LSWILLNTFVKGSANTYRIQQTNNIPVFGIKNGDTITITFTTPRLGLPVPKPEYIALHASCCKVAHQSGLAEYLEETLRELDETKVLAEDGSSSDLLSNALAPHALASISAAHCERSEQSSFGHAGQSSSPEKSNFDASGIGEG
jgi:hypothetical protein